MKQKRKNTMRRIISCLLCTSVIGTAAGTVSVTAVSDTAGSKGTMVSVDKTYTEVQRHFVKLDPINDDEAEITGFYEMPSYGYIPEEMEGFKIVGIGHSAFMSCDSIYGLRLPDTIRYLDRNAFSHCVHLEEINIPQSVHYIGDGAFESCESLESIDIPDGVTYIGEGAFWLCKKLKSFTFPKGVTEAADNVLSYDESLETITLHSGMTKIGNFSFRDNPLIESLYIPDSVEEIGDECFINCTGLKNIHLPEGWSEISDFMFYGCSAIESFDIDDCVTRIGKYAFYNCHSLKSLTIPDSVTFMGERSAGYKEGVPDWTYALEDGFTLYGSFGSAAEEYANENGISFVGSSPYDYEINDRGTLTITGYHGSAKDVIIPTEINGTAVNEIAFGAFAGTDITSVVIPDSIDTIDGCVFEECTSLKSVTLPSELKVFNNEMVGGQFRGCTSLESIVLPSDLEALGPFTFADCEKLSQVNVPDNILRMGSGVFANTAWMNSQPDGPVYFGKVLCSYKGDIPENTEVTVREGTKSIAAGAMAFDSGKNVISFVMPEGLEIIDELSLCNCINLKSITIPSTVTMIGNMAIGYYYDVQNNDFSRYSGLTIYGRNGSEAEKYADENEIEFIDPSALKNTSVINSDIVQVGDKVRISASARDGSGGYKYAYYYKRSTNTSWKLLGTEFGTNSSVSFTPTAEAEYDIKVIVKDSEGAAAEKYFTVKAVKELELSNVSVITRESVKLGGAIPMIGKAVGGTAPFTYHFQFKRSSNTSWKTLGEKFGMLNTARLKPTAKGSYDIRITVKDTYGKTAVKTFTAVVK